MRAKKLRQVTFCWVFEAEAVALIFMLLVVGCSVLYVLRFAGGPEGNIPSTFGWIGSVKKKPTTQNKYT